MAFDGLRPKTKREKRLDKKIYRASSRVNFLMEKINSDEQLIKDQEQKPAYQKEKMTPPLKQEVFEQLERPRFKKTAIIKIFLIILLIFLVSGTMYLSEVVFSSKDSLAGLNKFNPLKQLAHLVTSSDKRVAGELEDRVNILAMGIGGPGHDGPFLTDTIMLISIKPSTGEVGLVSLPRDMIIKLNDKSWVKVNEVYALGKAENEKTAAAYTKETIEENLDLPIHYFAIVSFKGFEEFIDNIGGIMVDVKTGFVDNEYPTDNFKTTTVSFNSGLQYMDGQTALIFARSRHGSNFEGSDFQRSKRQQQILQAIKDKIFKFSTLLSPQKLTSIYKLIDDYVETNISVWQAIKIAKMVEQTTNDKVYRFVLDDSPESLLEPGFTEQGAWILQPKDGNFQAISRMINNIFNIGIIKEEAAKIEIQNGTQTTGLAYWTMVYLERLGYKIIKYGNAQTQDYQKSVIYDLANGEKKKTLKWLKEELLAYTAKTLPDNILKQYPNLNATSTLPNADQPDFIAILGLNYSENFKLPEEKPLETATSTNAWAATTVNVFSTSTNPINE